MIKVSEIKIKSKVDWNSINWRKIQLRVWRIQRKIYEYSKRNEKTEVTRLQKVLVNLLETKLLAVRKVTQDNRGKKTAGVDGVRLLAPTKRFQLANSLKIDGRCNPIKRRLIPKPSNPEELRPLGIPTIRDRAKQALVLLALEPEWEAKFEKNSYGFRPGRRPHDAIEAIHSSINKSPKYVLDADIRKCFDQINHDALLEKLDTFPIMHRQVRAWLKAKIIMQDETIFPQEGTPQGGVLSPLLANIALNGIEEMLSDWIAEIPAFSPGGHRISKPNRRKRLLYVRYADDFVVLHPDREIVESAKTLIEEFLKTMGLELHPDKTRITHTYLSVYNQNPGFKFLGFRIRNYPVGKTKKGKRGAEYKTFIRPHPQNISDVLRKIKEILRQNRDVITVVERLNPIIRGWANYFSTVASKRTFSAMDSKLMVQLMRWGKRKHPTRSKAWIRSRYLFRDIKNEKSRLRFGYFSKKRGVIGIQYFAETPIVRHTKVTGDKSIYDHDLVYWSGRGRALGNRAFSKSILRILHSQNNKCNICGLKFLPGDVIEIDHIVPKASVGANHYGNLQAVHGHCHDQKL
jgi:RNA-directed DNA polymerase